VARGELALDRLPPLSKPVVPTGSSLTVRPPYNNLPVLPTPLIGRQHEVAQLKELLNDPQCRMLTLVGSGGIGKTRLAIETASQCPDDFEDGVYFVPLAPVATSRYIVPVVADSIGFSFQGESSLDAKSQLLNYLNEKQILLLVDNLEHLLSDPAFCDFFTELLACAAKVKLLVTLVIAGLQGEWVFEVHACQPGRRGRRHICGIVPAIPPLHVGFDATTEDFHTFAFAGW
jgi:predicted ATPase